MQRTTPTGQNRMGVEVATQPKVALILYSVKGSKGPSRELQVWDLSNCIVWMKSWLTGDCWLRPRMFASLLFESFYIRSIRRNCWKREF